MEDIERATMEDVSSFFRRFYVPSNASLAVVGDLDEDGRSRWWSGTSADSGGDEGGASLGARRQGSRRSISIVLHDRVELDRLYLIWPTVPQFHDDDAALILLGDILARGRSSRLYRKLVIEEQIAQDVTAYQSGRELAGSFGIVVTLRPSRSIDAGASLVDAELDALAATGVEPDELRRVQNQRVAGFFFALEHIGGFGGVADRLNAYNILSRRPVADHDRRRAVSRASPPIRFRLPSALSRRTSAG